MQERENLVHSQYQPSQLMTKIIPKNASHHLTSKTLLKKSIKQNYAKISQNQAFVLIERNVSSLMDSFNSTESKSNKANFTELKSATRFGMTERVHTVNDASSCISECSLTRNNT